MARDADGGQLLIQLAAENKIAYQLREAIGSVIFSNPDRSVRAAAAGFFPRPGGQPRMTVADVTAPRRRRGARAGAVRRQLLDLPSRRDPPGAEVGPDLTDIDKKFDRAGLVEAIVNPNAAIAFGFGAELFVTRRSEPHIGFLQADGPTVSIRDGYGRVRTIAREELAARVPLKSSLMPDPLALALTEQDVADIAAFLMRDSVSTEVGRELFHRRRDVLKGATTLLGAGLSRPASRERLRRRALQHRRVRLVDRHARQDRRMALARQLGLDGVQVSMGSVETDLQLRQPDVQRAYREAAEASGVRIGGVALDV